MCCPTVVMTQEYEVNHIIYACSPAGLMRTLTERYSWSPKFYDIKPEMNVICGKENASFSDIAKKLFRAPLCWKGRIFAGHVKPSFVATNHRALAVSLIHKAAIKYIRKHASSQAEEVGNAAQPIDVEAEEEHRLRVESLESLERSNLAQAEEIRRQKELLDREKDWRSRPRERESEENKRQHSGASTSRHAQEHPPTQKRRRN